MPIASIRSGSPIPSRVTQLADELDAAVNANVAPCGSVVALAVAGASRVSVGPTAQHVALGALDELAAELLNPSPGSGQ